MSIRDEIAEAMIGVSARGWLILGDNEEDRTDARALADAILPLLNRARAEALRKFRADLVESQLTSYGLVLPGINEIVEALDDEATLIEQNSEGNAT